MNTRIYLFFLLCTLGGAYCLAETKALSKSSMKNYKNECKQLKKDGWKVFDNASSVDDAMMKYYLKLEAGGENVMTVIGIGQDLNINTAYTQAKHRASVALASKKGVRVENQTIVKMSNSDDGSTSDIHSMNYAQAEQIIRTQKPVASLCRKQVDGTTEINLFYIIGFKQN